MIIYFINKELKLQISFNFYINYFYNESILIIKFFIKKLLKKIFFGLLLILNFIKIN